MSYIKCIRNDVYVEGHEGQTYGDLIVGNIYRALPYDPATDGPYDPKSNKPYMVRVRGEFSREAGGEEGYLYPVSYFEPFSPDLEGATTAPVTVHLPPDLKEILHTEALNSGLSVSKLMCDWAET